MKRNEWEFRYPADVLLKAATDKKGYHAGRLEWWEGKKKEIIAKVRAEGLEIEESLVEHHMSSNAYRNETITIRADLVNDMRECVAKVTEHRGKVKEYDAWMQTFASQGKNTYDLHHDDWMFFFGK